jgi:Concanavalin A-like lectin/glucanases superfamily
MKTRFQLLLLALTLIATSCIENENPATESGSVQFSIGQLASENARVQNEASAVLITVKRSDGSLAYNRQKLTLYTFGSEFISEPVSFLTGNYQLTEFFVLNENDEVIYAAPLEGSELAYLVEKPLPIDFTISKDETIKVIPEVLEVETHTPADFGYATFAFNVVPTFTFSVAVFTYSEQTDNFELTASHISVTGDESSVYANELGAVTNHLRVRDGYTSYSLAVTKSGYQSYLATFSAAELKAYTGENILKIILMPGDSIINRAAAFDGYYDFIDMGDIYNDAQLPLTISAWVNVTDAGQLYYPVFSSQDVDAIYNGFTFVVTYSHIGFTYGDGQGENHYMYRRSKSAPHNSAVFGQWVHIAAVVRGATDMDIYMDGVDIGGEYAGGSELPMASDFPAPARIGSIYSNGIIEHFNGMMDELNIWDRALSPAEIAALRLKKLTGNESGLIGYWSFDEAEGVTVFDNSQNGFNGIFGGDTHRVISGTPELH